MFFIRFFVEKSIMKLFFIRFERKFCYNNFSSKLLNLKKNCLYQNFPTHTYIQILGILSHKKGCWSMLMKIFFHEVCLKKFFFKCFFQRNFATKFFFHEIFFLKIFYHLFKIFCRNFFLCLFLVNYQPWIFLELLSFESLANP